MQEITYSFGVGFVIGIIIFVFSWLSWISEKRNLNNQVKNYQQEIDKLINAHQEEINKLEKAISKNAIAENEASHSMKTEMDSLREKNTELKIEVEVLREKLNSLETLSIYKETIKRMTTKLEDFAKEFWNEYHIVEVELEQQKALPEQIEDNKENKKWFLLGKKS